MDRQAVLAEALGHDFYDTLGIPLIAEADYEVIRIANQKGTTAKSRRYLPLEPKVQHVVQEHVR